MVLYATTKQLENTIKENGLTKELSKAQKTLLQQGIEFGIGDNYGKINQIAKTRIGKDAAGMLV